jgi:hypothetical protein
MVAGMQSSPKLNVKATTAAFAYLAPVPGLKLIWLKQPSNQTKEYSSIPSRRRVFRFHADQASCSADVDEGHMAFASPLL